MRNKGTIPQSAKPTAPFRQGRRSVNPTTVRRRSPSRIVKGSLNGEIILNVITAVSLMIFAWLFVSYIDIIAHNLTTQQYASWNAWEIMLKLVMRN